MPGIEDWINCPLPIIQRLFEESSKNHATKFEEYFFKRIQAAQSKGQLPSLNDVPTHNLPTDSLVQFRAMVQDMHDPEFYLGVYEVENRKSGQTYLKTGKYRDIAECGPQEEIKLDSERNVTIDRQTFYCVPVPGENSWVKQEYAKQNGSERVSDAPSTSTIPYRMKRSLDEDDLQQSNESAALTDASKTEPNESMETESGDAETNAEAKKSKTTSTNGASKCDPLDLNFPLPGEVGPACIVKVYQEESGLKLNDVIEIVGVLSNNPVMASFPDDSKKEKSAFLEPESDVMEGLDEDVNQARPPSLVPRLHALTIRKLNHSNPLLPQAQDGSNDSQAVDSILAEMSQLRSTLLSVMTKLLFGDRLCAEFLLCNLVSSVYARQDVVALGKYALNISGCPREGQLPKLLHGFVKELVTKSHYLPMSLDNMNKLKFVPRKDYKANRLDTGVLQLSNKTHLVLDETALQPGQLDNNGVSNIASLGNVVLWQKSDYDFNFHKQEFHTDIITLVLSEGKSILKCDSQVPLVASGGGFPPDVEAHFTDILSRELSSVELMNKLRAYIGLVQQLPYSLSDQLQKDIEQDFVDTRKADTSKMSVDDFHSLLVLARLLALTHGEKELTREIWERAKVLEVERKTRLVLTSGEPSRD